MKSKKLLVAAAIVCSVWPLSCSRQSQQKEDVARVDGQTLTMESVHRQIDTTNGVSEMQVRMFARQWVNSELLFQEAKRLGLDNSDEVRKNLEDVQRQLTINALLEKEVFNDKPQSVSRDEVDIYFRNHQEEFALREDIVNVSMVIFSDRKPADEFREAALHGQGWVPAVAEFQDPAQHDSPIITKADSTFFTQATLFPAKLWKVASALGAGEVSFPVRTTAGYFVILSLGSYSRGSTPPVDYVADAIRGRLVMEKRQQRYVEYIETLRKKHSVQINLTGISADHDSVGTGGE